MNTVRFDTNIYYHLCNRNVIPYSIYNKFEQHIKNGTFVIFDNVISLIELLRKLIEKGDKVVKALEIAEKLCRNNFLPTPEIYLQNQLEVYYNKTKTVTDMSWISIRKKAINAYQKKDINCLSNIVKIASELDKNSSTFVEESEKITKGFQALLIDAFPKLANLLQFKINEKNWNLIMKIINEQPKFKKIILHQILKLFQVPNDLIKNTDHTAIDKINTLNLFYRYYFMLLRQYIIYGRKPDQNDYEDLLQVIYLTSTDFFVYHDNKFKTVLENTFSNDPIINKLISLSDLVNSVNNF